LCSSDKGGDAASRAQMIGRNEFTQPMSTSPLLYFEERSTE
jgi:hypothetical protein